MENPEGHKKLDIEDIVKGLTENLCLIEESLAILAQLNESIIAANVAGHGHLVSRLQSMLERYTILAVTRLFEPEEDGYHSLSIPVALNHMRFNADYLEIRDREVIFKKLISFGHERKEFDSIPNPWINQLVRKEFADRLPQPKDPESSDLGKALFNLKCMRDIPVSEDEKKQGRVDSKDIEREIKTLLVYAGDFVNTISGGYLGVNLEIDRNTIVSEFKQLLNTAGITV